jgi:O-succinylbenzoic acid--CoA ligase
MNAGRPYVVTDAGSWSPEEVRSEALATAGRYASAGIGTGDRVGILGRNRPAWVWHVDALERLGATLVPLHPRLSEAELARQAESAGIRLLIHDQDLPPVAAGALSLTWTAFEGLRPASWVPAPDSADREAMIVFTSGSSGHPKGIVLTRASIAASVEAAVEALGLGPDDRWLLCLPLCHVGGLMILHRCRRAGASILVQPSFDACAVSSAIDRQGATIVSLVSMSARRLLDERRGLGFPASLRAVIVGGGPVPPDLADADPRILATYGMTETCSMVTLVRLGSGPDERRSAGSPLRGVEIRTDTEHVLEIRGPMVAARDLHGRTLTDPDGWLRTGDAGRVDGTGCLHVHGRRDEVIISGGENIHPGEIEAALLTHPGIAEAVVVGAPDPEWGERPVAFVVPRGPEIDEGSILAHLEGKLARFKIPRLMIFSSIPALPSGKPDRMRMRDGRYSDEAT